MTPWALASLLLLAIVGAALELIAEILTVAVQAVGGAGIR